MFHFAFNGRLHVYYASIIDDFFLYSFIEKNLFLLFIIDASVNFISSWMKKADILSSLEILSYLS